MNADEYRKLAEVEDRMWYFGALHGHIERELVRAFGDGPASVLDAGCGTGGLIARLAPRHRAWNWTALDVSELAVSYAQQRLAGHQASSGTSEMASKLRLASVHLGSVTALPFADQAFDAIVSADVLYHVDDDETALREFMRVLRPGGFVVLNVPAYRWLWSYHDVAVHSRRRYSRPDIVGKLRAAGFSAMRATYWNTLPFPLMVVRRKLLPAPRAGSDVHVYPAPVEAMFNVAMAFEGRWLRAFGALPFGGSVFAVAHKT
jgi:SAM-dependent methyltransferase